MGARVFELATRRATVRLGRLVGRAIRPGDLVVLAGELGAGKTFLARAICRAAGVPGDVRVTSPTFTLIHEHQGRIAIAHADLYRIESEADLVELGLRDRRAEGAALVVEWGERFADALGGDAVVVHLTLPHDNRPRAAALDATGPTSQALLERIEAAAAAEPTKRTRS